MHLTSFLRHATERLRCRNKDVTSTHEIRIIIAANYTEQAYDSVPNIKHK